MRKMMKAIAAVLAVSALTAGSAFAAEKLAVKATDGTTTVFSVSETGKTIVSGTQVSTGSNAVGAEITPTLVAGQNSDFLYGLKLAPIINTNGFTGPLLYSLSIPGSTDGIIRMKFDNTNAGTGAQAGIEMNNNAGQALITFYGSNYSSTSLRNAIYYKNAVGGMKFLGFTGSTIGFGIGTAAADANALTIDALKRINLGNVPGPYADNAAATAALLPVGTLYRTSTGAVMVVY
ncbi:hypothetical protein OR1_01205 [Geobacter sp. OR-1]|uniref:hypothetical protein n=1 Tax=Geobacter sp. OR-1 TaxID=1266765 RepID=UPI000543A58C|nr:hypothetical protein [Geobacter sp. OR-1]GAM08931.1 hypothetical protein OR1_01205 [Geobacter sp. OR-1]